MFRVILIRGFGEVAEEKHPDWNVLNRDGRTEIREGKQRHLFKVLLKGKERNGNDCKRSGVQFLFFVFEYGRNHGMYEC